VIYDGLQAWQRLLHGQSAFDLRLDFSLRRLDWHLLQDSYDLLFALRPRFVRELFVA